MMPCIAVVLLSGDGVRLAYNVAICRKHFGEGIPVVCIKNALRHVLEEPPECCSITTVSEEPESLLSRNNGIVFRAEAVTLEEPNTLALTNGSIVNGCQTEYDVCRSPCA
jgi:hypothetical protein